MIGGCYFFAGLGYFYQAFRNKGRKGEYIEWDQDFLAYKPNLGKLHRYPIRQLKGVTVAENNLIIKAPNAQGTMAPLKGYSENDILKLRDAFQRN